MSCCVVSIALYVQQLGERLALLATASFNPRRRAAAHLDVLRIAAAISAAVSRSGNLPRAVFHGCIPCARRQQLQYRAKLFLRRHFRDHIFRCGHHSCKSPTRYPCIMWDFNEAHTHRFCSGCHFVGAMARSPSRPNQVRRFAGIGHASHNSKRTSPRFWHALHGCHSGPKPRAGMSLTFKDENEARAGCERRTFWNGSRPKSPRTDAAGRTETADRRARERLVGGFRERDDAGRQD